MTQSTEPFALRDLTQEAGPLHIGMPVSFQQNMQGPIMEADAIGPWAIYLTTGQNVVPLPQWPLPPAATTDLFDELWSEVIHLDGLLLPAHLSDSRWYEQWFHPSSRDAPAVWRWRREIALAQLASFLGIPVLAIGQGAEQWFIALGGHMHGYSIPGRKPLFRRGRRPEHWLASPLPMEVCRPSTLSHLLEPSSFLFEDRPRTLPCSYPPPEITLEDLAPTGLSCGARFSTERVSAVERTDGPFGLGIYGRIDWAYEQYAGVFSAFAQACRLYAASIDRNTLTTQRSTLTALLRRQLRAQQTPFVEELKEREQTHSHQREAERQEVNEQIQPVMVAPATSVEKEESR